MMTSEIPTGILTKHHLCGLLRVLRVLHSALEPNPALAGYDPGDAEKGSMSQDQLSMSITPNVSKKTKHPFKKLSHTILFQGSVCILGQLSCSQMSGYYIPKLTQPLLFARGKKKERKPQVSNDPAKPRKRGFHRAPGFHGDQAPCTYSICSVQK